MRSRHARRLAAVLPIGVLLGAAAPARAQQIDVNPPKPNVLLLIDNSGSMERMIDGSKPEDSQDNTCNCDLSGNCTWSPTCSANLPAGSHCPQPNRWGILLQALTGTMQNGYSCVSMPRSPNSPFTDEYKINNVNPYDTNYYLPYHRPVVQDPKTGSPCVYGPGGLPGATITGSGVGKSGAVLGGNATDFPPNAIIQHVFNPTAPSPATCSFAQFADGALDSNLDLMRFGLMTFDQDPDPGVGVTSSGTSVATPAFTGMWSYYPGWNGAALPAWTQGLGCSPTPPNSNYCGRPANCTVETLMAVGARNPAAPPWEGRMMPFPVATDLTTQELQNQNIQAELLATRPYGATPLAGMFVGAQYYLRSDPSGPNGDSQHADPFVQGGCRSQYIILLTDGAPNLDMQPACSQTGSGADAGASGGNGVCPFPLPETTAQTLSSSASGPPVTTYVIGFAVSRIQDPAQPATPIGCSTLSTNDARCTSTDPATVALYGPCCELNRIAVAGGTTQAYFADTPGDLQNALGTILAQIAKNFTTRTTPSYSPVVTNVTIDPNTPPNAQSNETVFLASFKPIAGKPWSGDVQRQRFACQANGQGSGYTLKTQTVDPTLGDDFAANVNSNAGTLQRTFVMMQPYPISGGTAVDSSATIRPFVSPSVGDGMGQYNATTYTGGLSSFIGGTKITPAALGLTDNTCTYNNSSGTQTFLPATQCFDMVLDYTFAAQTFGDQPNFPFVSRYGSALGDIYHAVPAVVGPPGSLLRDDSYIGFRGNFACRKQVVYAATNDGLLHAFWADETKLENNELWAMVPPAVMPHLFASYPASDQFLLDGTPIVKDVIWDRSIANNWHTTLVASFGPSWPGYYAVDVTNPELGAQPCTATAPQTPGGPTFLWQLTKMPSTNAPLFAAHSATPTITTLFVNPGDGNPREIAVAILPGGQNSAPTTYHGAVASCARSAKPSDASPVGADPWRTSVRCWGTPQVGVAPANTDPVIGRSVSIVRIDTGEILRVFMPPGDHGAFTNDTLATGQSRYTDTALDSPMIGTPIVYPSDVGTDATRAFIGDADGTIWRFDLSNTDPSKWVGELFLDAYNTDVDKSGTQPTDGQPIQVPMVTSLDLTGNLVLNFGTAGQDTFDSNGTYYMYSVSEVVAGTPAKMHAQVNWWLDPSTVTNSPGERVSGPMTVFDSAFYFATYAAAPQGSQSCTSGHGRIWGLDFVQPNDPTTLSKGGLPRLVAPPVNHNNQYIQPDETDSTLLGVVIPGVTINATPACAGLPTAGPDQYVAGQTHSMPQGFQPGQYSVYSQLGTTGTNGQATRQFNMQVPTPMSPTTVDSWAAVLE